MFSPERALLTLAHLPTLNAFLNATSAVLLLVGLYLIRHGRREAHRICMLSALATSALFLISYLVYHLNVGSVAFAGQGPSRPVYYAILFSHVSLAALTVPLVLIVLYRALTNRFGTHRTLARKTFALWLYVSTTGVVVYLMLYRLFPAR
ncbi:MAG: DUF420 domain-containing protein [Chloroflexi bacterium]|nr:DUF420 domain-containing protein [Chloroflexota bacterium]